jgi:hypothetical protein
LYEGVTAGSPLADLSPDDTDLLHGAMGALRDAELERDVICAPNDQAAALLQTHLAKQYRAEGAVTPTDFSDAHEAQFDRGDVGWLRTAIPYIRSRLGIEHRDPRPPFTQAVDEVAGDCRLALLGDWGTNLYGAPPAAESIAADGEYQALVHLGDVYYSGSHQEVEEKFLLPWSRMSRGNANAVSRACNSNHEMFSGGGPYFTMTLPEFGQASSTFVLRNDHWLMVGLDTAYHDHRLDPEQIRWLDTVTSASGNRRVILFTHHQPFSQFNEQGPDLVNDLDALLASGKIFAWYWGHEHLHALYDPHPRWGFHGRCVGHSGFPYKRFDERRGRPEHPLVKDWSFFEFASTPDAPTAQLLDGPNDYLGSRREEYGTNGYMRLEFDGPDLHEVVLAPDGTELWSDQLT